MTAGNIPIRHVIVEPAQWRALHRDPYGDEAISVRVTAGRRAYEAELRIRGGHTRGYPKPSYELRIQNGHTFHWNAEYDDPAMMRNALSFYFFNQIGVPAPKTAHFKLVVNGDVLGVYLEIEAVVPAFFHARRLPYRSIVYAINDRAHFGQYEPRSKTPKPTLFAGYEKVAGDEGTRTRLIRFIRGVNRLKGSALRRHLASKLDIDNYLGWLAGAVLTGNYDGFEQNYALYEHAPSGKYRIIPWDYEGTWGRNCFGVPCGSQLVRLQGYNALTAKLFTFARYRQAYKLLMRRLLREHFTVRSITPAAMRISRTIAADLRTDSTRKHPFTVFQGEVRFIRNYVRGRRRHILRMLKRWK
jgi:spore coat protein H